MRPLEEMRDSMHRIQTFRNPSIFLSAKKFEKNFMLFNDIRNWLNVRRFCEFNKPAAASLTPGMMLRTYSPG